MRKKIYNKTKNSTQTNVLFGITKQPRGVKKNRNKMWQKQCHLKNMICDADGE